MFLVIFKFLPLPLHTSMHMPACARTHTHTPMPTAVSSSAPIFDVVVGWPFIHQSRELLHGAHFSSGLCAEFNNSVQGLGLRQ